jgi:hypothetical protein
MLESKVEKYLVKRIEAIGGTAEKFTSPNRRSVPDRLVLLGHRLEEDHYGCPLSQPLIIPEAIFVELKAPGKKPTPAQQRDHERRRAMGFRVEVLDSVEAVDEFVEGL